MNFPSYGVWLHFFAFSRCSPTVGITIVTHLFRGFATNSTVGKRIERQMRLDNLPMRKPQLSIC